MISRFNVRVYGILIHENHVLLADEIIAGKNITKFPGGGLEFGEGTLECLKREFNEELNARITIKSHFYTTDFFVPSAFHDQSQIISIYYIVELEEGSSVTDMNPNDKLTFRWISAEDLGAGEMTLVIDKKVADMIRAAYSE